MVAPCGDLQATDPVAGIARPPFVELVRGNLPTLADFGSGQRAADDRVEQFGFAQRRPTLSEQRPFEDFFDPTHCRIFGRARPAYDGGVGQ